MDTIKINSGKTLMIAHRGVSKLERENTCPAFLSAASRSYYGIETDVHPTRDGKLVTIHDSNLKHVSGEKYTIDVEQTDYCDFADIVLPDLDGSTIRRDIRVPLFKEYLAICKKYGKRAVVEIKGIFSYDNIVKLVDEVKELDYIDGVIFIAFDLENCINVRKLLPDAEVQFLANNTPQSDAELTALLREHRLDLDVFYKRLTKEWIDELHAAGIKVNCWTCDDPVEAEKLVGMGIDFITSNILE